MNVTSIRHSQDLEHCLQDYLVKVGREQFPLLSYLTSSSSNLSLFRETIWKGAMLCSAHQDLLSKLETTFRLPFSRLFQTKLQSWHFFGEIDRRSPLYEQRLYEKCLSY